MSAPKSSVFSNALLHVSTLLLSICFILPLSAHAQVFLTASPNPIVVPAGAWQGTTTFTYNAPGYSNVELRVGSPTGAVFSCCGPSGSYSTGNWVGNGANFFLLDGNTGTVLASTTVYLTHPTISASPNPIIVPAGATTGTTTISYNAPGYSNVEVHVGSPTGTLFSCCGPSASFATGNWVGDGAPFYLVDGNTGTVLQSVTVHLVNAILTASPNPIIVSPGSSTGVTTINYGALGYPNLQVHLGSSTGPLFACCGPFASYTTGNWVLDGTQFVLVDGDSGATLQTLTVGVQSTAATLTANPNPIRVPPGVATGVTTISWNAPGHSNVRVHMGWATGPVFACCGSSASFATGNWVQDGSQFVLVDEDSGTTLQTLTVNLQNSAVPVGGSLDPSLPLNEYIYGNGRGIAVDHIW